MAALAHYPGVCRGCRRATLIVMSGRLCVGIVVQFGLLTGCTIILAFLADLLLAPALMALVMGREEVASPATHATEGIT